jgi:hypothetical protein
MPSSTRKFQNAYQSAYGRPFRLAEPTFRGSYRADRDYRRKRKVRNEMAHQSRKRNRA